MIAQLKKLRSFVLVYLTHHLALPILKWIRKAKPFPYSINELKQMQKGSLGNDLAMFLHNRDLHLLTYYVRHDLKHILLGYETTEQGEVCL